MKSQRLTVLTLLCIFILKYRVLIIHDFIDIGHLALHFILEVQVIIHSRFVRHQTSCSAFYIKVQVLFTHDLLDIIFSSSFINAAIFGDL